MAEQMSQAIQAFINMLKDGGDMAVAWDVICQSIHIDISIDIPRLRGGPGSFAGSDVYYIYTDVHMLEWDSYLLRWLILDLE